MHLFYFKKIVVLAMQIWNLPSAFDQYKQRISSKAGIELVLYKSTQEVEKVNVQINRNLLVLLLQGQKKVYAPQHKIALQPDQGFFIRKGKYLMSEKFAQIEHYESLMVFFDDEIAQQLSTPLLHHLQQPPPANKIEDIVKVAASSHTKVFAASLKNYFDAELPPNFDEMLKIKLQELFWILSQELRALHLSPFSKICKTNRWFRSLS